MVYDRSLNQTEAVQEVHFAAPTATATLQPTSLPTVATPIPPTDTPVPPTDTPVPPTDTPAPSPAPTLPAAPTLAAAVVPATAVASMAGEPANIETAEQAAESGLPFPDWLLYVVGAVLGCLILAFAGLAVAMAMGRRSGR